MLIIVIISSVDVLHRLGALLPVTLQIVASLIKASLPTYISIVTEYDNIVLNLHEHHLFRTICI